MKRRNFLAMGAAVTGGSAWGSRIDVIEWTEEVKLSDGRMITIWRRARAYSGGWPNTKRGSYIDFELKYYPLGISWKGNWSRQLLSFDIINNVPYLVAYIGDRESCAILDPTDYAANFLRWQNGQWIDIRQKEFPISRAIVNLSSNFIGHTHADDYKGLIKWEEKRLPSGWNQNNPDTVKLYFERGNNYCRNYIR